MRKLVDWLIGGNLDRLLKALGGEEYCSKHFVYLCLAAEVLPAFFLL